MSQRHPFGFEDAHEAAESVAEQTDKAGLAQPRISLTLGSGLRSFADRYTNEDSRLVIPYGTIPRFPDAETPVAGHDGKLIIAPIEQDPKETMAIWAGRRHFYQTLMQRVRDQYEKISDPEVRKAAVVFYIAICRALGVDCILTSNAVGSVRRDIHQKGDIVRVTDHILDPDMDFGVPEDRHWFTDKAKKDPDYKYDEQDYFYGQGNLYSAEIEKLVQEVMRESNIVVKEGILNWRAGRGYESPAMIRAIRTKGVDLAGMSTAPEAQKARTVGYSNAPGERQFAAFSVVSNVAQLDHDQILKHAEVQETADATEDKFNFFMYRLILHIRNQLLPQISH